MLYSELSVKGGLEGVGILEKLRTHYPKLKSTLFGIVPRPKEIPGWIDYYHTPTVGELRELYNQHAIFLCSSFEEGWPLPPAESMSCECALVGYDIGGLREYAIHGKTALLAPLKDESQIIQHLCSLIENQNRRIRIARQGYELMTTRFSWERSVSEMERCFEECIAYKALSTPPEWVE